MKLSRILIAFVLGLVCLLGIGFVLGGVLIPAEKSFTQETEIDASAETVWKVLTEREKYTEWQDKLSAVKIIDENRWVEIVKDVGPIDFYFVRKEKPKTLEIKYATPSGVDGQWLGEIKPVSYGRTVITTTDKSIVKSWIAKIFMSMFFDIEEFAKDWNQKLKARAESLEKGSSKGKENQ
ncbi:MAG: hypothetical protein HKN25_07655 [Pyrinomonadaceae bacterium]|nr:hypothetical protein [Pyrinomonadaceae bacterium]